MEHPLTIDAEIAQLRGDARETSRLAALRYAPRSGSTRRRVLIAIVNSEDGMTDDEIAEFCELSPNTARPRRIELVEGHWVMDSMRRRDSFYGNPATVWVATPKGRELFAGREHAL